MRSSVKPENHLGVKFEQKIQKYSTNALFRLNSL